MLLRLADWFRALIYFILEVCFYRSVRKHLYKPNDVTACAVLGSIFVELCIRAGISCAEWIPYSENQSEATKVFLDAITRTGFLLEEPEEIRFADTHIYREKKGPDPPKIV